MHASFFWHDTLAEGVHDLLSEASLCAQYCFFAQQPFSFVTHTLLAWCWDVSLALLTDLKLAGTRPILTAPLRTC